MSAPDLKLQIVNNAYDGFRAGNLEGFLEPFGDDATLVEPDALPYGGTHRGRDAVRKAMLAVLDTWTDIRFEQHEMLSGDTHVIVFGRLFVTAPKTGRQLDFPLAEVWKFDGTRLISMTPMYFDTAATLQALSN